MEGIRKNRKAAPPFIKIGRAVRYLREDLDQWLNQQVKLQHLPCNGVSLKQTASSPSLAEGNYIEVYLDDIWEAILLFSLVL